MNVSDWQRLKTVLADALECSSEADRQRFIQTLRDTEPALTAEAAKFLHYADEVADDQWLLSHSFIARSRRR